VTDMSQPLGEAVGNALDVAEAVAVLRGDDRGRLRQLSVWFAARALETLGGRDDAAGESAAEAALDGGGPLERFRLMVEAQGGDPRVVDDPWSVLPRAPVVAPLTSDRAGVLAAVEAEEIGLASSALGAGRIRKGDPIDPSVGIVIRPKVGDRLEAGGPIGEIHARDRSAAADAARRVLAALTLVDGPVEPPPLVHGWYA